MKKVLSNFIKNMTRYDYIKFDRFPDFPIVPTFTDSGVLEGG